MSDEIETLRARVAALAARVDALESLAEARALAVPMLDFGSRSLNARYNYGREWETEVTLFQSGLLRHASADDGVESVRLDAMRAPGDRIFTAVSGLT